MQRIGESGTDRYNNPVKTVTETVSYPASFTWETSVEDNIDRELRQSLATVIVGPEVDVEATDRVVYDGLTFEVQGRPIEVFNHHGLHHKVLNLKVYEG